jgi:predicted ATPase
MTASGAGRRRPRPVDAGAGKEDAGSVYLSAIRRRPGSAGGGFPWTVPVVASLEAVEFRQPVTFFVGENGSGKSTILEGIAAGLNAIAVGSADVKRDESLRAARELASRLRFERVRHPRTTVFFRAEDVFGFTRRMLQAMHELHDIEQEFRRELPEGSYGQQLATSSARAQRRAIEDRYGRDPDARSHGEVFLSLLASRLTPGGLHLLDEPEAPLSPRGVLQLLALLRDRVARQCQFIIATHSPMLLALPEAEILVFEGGTIRSTPYDEVEHVQLTKSFLESPHRFLRHLTNTPER